MTLRGALLVAALTPATLFGQQEPAPIEAGVAPAPGRYAPGVDALSYDVEVGVGRVDHFAGRVTMRVLAEDDAPLLPLDLTGLRVDGVSVEGSRAPFEHVDGVVRIPLMQASAGDTVSVEIRYSGVPDDALALQENVHGNLGAFVDNWPNRTRFWLPTIDHPADKATVDYLIHAPAEWQVIANGAQVGEPTPTPAGALGPADEPRRSWRWSVGVPISTYNMVFGATEMEVRSVGTAACGLAPASRRDDGCVDVTYWVFPEDLDKAEASFGRAAEMVDYFTATIGPYPFEKLANVQSSTRFGGMENASAIFYSEQAIASGRSIEGTVSHEIAHQWFGDAVTEASWHHLWLSEGFATYFGALYFEYADGIADFRDRMEQSRQRIITTPDAERPVVDPEERSLFALLNANNYPKGGWVLHMLRGILGDEAFFAGIKSYYGSNVHSAVLTEDFQRAMEEVSGRDLEWFFRQWIHSPGYPVFDVSHSWDAATGTVTVRVDQVQRDEWPRFRTPATIVVGSGEHQSVRRVELDGTEDVFTFEAAVRPERVEVDPDGWILKGESR